MKTKPSARGTRRHKSPRDNFKVCFGVDADTNTRDACATQLLS